MRRTMELDGRDWTVEAFLGADAARRVATQTDAGARAAAIPASVPGSILDDVARAGHVPNPYVGLNSLAAEWVPERAWLYRRRVELPPLEAGDRAWLAFDGLDHAGEVFWDGAAIGRHDGMFVPFEVELTHAVSADGGAPHDLAVVVEPAPESESQLGRTSLVRAHKSRMAYGWDFCPRMIHQGLWQSLRLEIAGGMRIPDVWAHPRLAPDLRSATVDVHVTLDAVTGRSCLLEAAVVGESPGRAGSRVEVQAGRNEVALELSVDEPALWWPNGSGPAIVHRLQVRVVGDDGVLDERSVPLGFRRLERIPNDGAPGDARPWTFVVNGRRLYVRGWNWVPQDVQYGVPRPERLEHLMRLAKDAHVNLLRVWGGGLIETEAFYNACDASGLLVWQEFAQSSSLTDAVPSDDPEFVSRMAEEVRAIVPLRRNHPSLAAWCGGNELEGPDGSTTRHRSSVPFATSSRSSIPTASGSRRHPRVRTSTTDSTSSTPTLTRSTTSMGRGSTRAFGVSTSSTTAAPRCSTV